MSNVTIKGASSLQSEIDEILTASEAEIRIASYEASKKTAKEIVKVLKSSSPKRKGGYSKGWKATAEEDGYVVHNGRYPGLTHLLENGHDLVVNGAKVGRVSGEPHIKPAENLGIQMFELEVKDEIERRLGNG